MAVIRVFNPATRVVFEPNLKYGSYRSRGLKWLVRARRDNSRCLASLDELPAAAEELIQVSDNNINITEQCSDIDVGHVVLVLSVKILSRC